MNEEKITDLGIYAAWLFLVVVEVWPLLTDLLTERLLLLDDRVQPLAPFLAAMVLLQFWCLILVAIDIAENTGA